MEMYYSKKEFELMKNSLTRQLKEAEKIINRQKKIIDNLKERNNQ